MGLRPRAGGAPLKRLDTGILLLAVFKPELEMDYPSETGLSTVAPSPTDTPSPIFSRGRGGFTLALVWFNKDTHALGMI